MPAWINRVLGFNLLAIPLFLCCTIGCSKKPFPLAYTSGICTCNGEPMSGGLIILSPIHDPEIHGQKRLVGKSAQGLIQPDGSFVLTTYKPNDGAVIGKHAVELSLSVLEDDAPKQPCKTVGPNVTVEVLPGKNTLEIELAGK